MRSRIIVVVGLLVASCLSALLAPAKLSAAEPDVKQLLVKYRKAALDAKRRVAVVRELVDVGPAGVTAIQELLEKDLVKLETGVPEPPKLDTYDEKVTELRKKLADVRSDANLTKERIESEGLPALEQLTAVWHQREMASAQHYQKIAKTAALVERQSEFLAKLQEQWRDVPGGGPLPVMDWVGRADKLHEKAAPPVDAVIRQVAEDNAKLASQLDRDLVTGMNALNAMRVMVGLRPLTFDPKLCEAARGHSGDMQNQNFFAHESPVPGKKAFTDRAKLAGTTSSGENIYMGSSGAADAIKAWFLSPGHHKNMFGEGHKRQGLGRVGKHWTQMFGA